MKGKRIFTDSPGKNPLTVCDCLCTETQSKVQKRSRERKAGNETRTNIRRLITSLEKRKENNRQIWEVP